MESIIASLDKLAKLQDELSLAISRFESAREEILMPVQDALDELDAMMVEETAEIRLAIARREREIRDAVIAGGKTVKGSVIQAVYNNARVSWDSRALDGYAVGHPELFAFRKEGQPSVTIREVKR